MNKEHAVTVPQGTYILGDPCYVISNDDWDEWLRRPTEYGYGGVLPGGHFAIGFKTQFGDGLYPAFRPGGNVATLPVDAGLVGLVPLAYDPSELHAALNTRVVFDAPTLCTRYPNGLMQFGDWFVSTGDD